MTSSTNAGKTAYSRAELQAQLIEIIRSELPDKNVEVAMDTRADSIDVDSLAIIQTVFKVEEQYGITVPVATDTPFETVGDLVNKLIDCFPPEKLTA